VVADETGRAAAHLRLGMGAGKYTVIANCPQVSNDQITYQFYAIPAEQRQAGEWRSDGPSSALLSLIENESRNSTGNLPIPPADSGNRSQCRNGGGGGGNKNPSQQCPSCPSCSQASQGSGSTGNSSGQGTSNPQNQNTGSGCTEIYTGAFLHYIIDYRMEYGMGYSGGCCDQQIPSGVESVHYPPYVLEFSRYFESRMANVDYGLGKGWTHNFFFSLNISNHATYRTADLILPRGAGMTWIDEGLTGSWKDNTEGGVSQFLQLIDESGDAHLVIDRWGGKHHFIPNRGSRSYMQYLCDWIEDNNGNRLTFTYDAAGYLSKATDPFNRSMEYTWSESWSWHNTWYRIKHITKVILPDSHEIRITYEGPPVSGDIDLQDVSTEPDLPPDLPLTGSPAFPDPAHPEYPSQEIAVYYSNGYVATYGWGWDDEGKYFYCNDPMGEPGSRKERVYFYLLSGISNTGRVRAVKDETGHVKYSRWEDPETTDTIVLYDDGREYFYRFGDPETGNAESLLNELMDLNSGSRSRYKRGSTNGLLYSETDPYGHKITYEYNEAGLMIKKVYPDCKVHVKEWMENMEGDGTADLTAKTKHPSFEDQPIFEAWTYNSYNQIETYRDRNGKWFGYEYDTGGNRIKKIYPDTSCETWERDPVYGRITRYIDRNGNPYDYDYDMYGNLTKITLPANSGESNPEI